MDPVSWLENVAKGSPIVLLIVMILALFVDSLSVVGVLLPGDLLLLVPSAVVGLRGSLIIVLGGVFGTVLGYAVSYAVGHRAGPAIRNSRLGKWVGEPRWVQAERMLNGPAGRTLVFVQFMPILNYLIPLLAGSLHVPLKRFIQLTTAGAVVYCGSYALLGALAGGTGEAIGASTGRLVGVLMVAMVVAVLGLTVLTKATRRLTGGDDADGARRDTCGGREVDAEPSDVADSPSCAVATTTFFTGTGSRCP